MVSVKSVSQVVSDFGVKIPELVGSQIGGQARTAQGQASLLPVTYPATGEQVAQLSCANEALLDEAVDAARHAFTRRAWSGMAVAGRQQVLRESARLIRANASELALLETLCAGLPLSHLSARQVPRAAENFSFFADYIGNMAGETFEQADGFLTMVTREPAGVAALISPWNAPLALSSMQIASAIAFGNSCVLKPSEHTPLAVSRMVELLTEAGVPDGVVNLVNGEGASTGSQLAAHAGIDRLAFTGGTRTARSIMRQAAGNLTPVHFELGGKSANIVFSDADLERAIDGSLVNIFSNNGQICIAGSRILVQRGIAEEFIGKFVDRARAVRVGDPVDIATEVGPLAFEAHMQRVLGYFDLAREEGAEMLCGGRRDERFDRGYFVRPSVALVDNNHGKICQQEVFGPFATIQIFDDEDEAIAIANDSEYGLVSYAWTNSLALTMKLQTSIQAGTVWVNTPLLRDLRAPFGGFKNSGIGRDGPRQCADFFSEEKATIVPRRPGPINKMGNK